MKSKQSEITNNGAAATQQAEKPDVLAAEIEGGVWDLLSNSDLTPPGRCAALLRDVARMEVHPSRRSEVAALVREFRGAAPALVKRDAAALDQGLREWWTKFFYGGFASPPVEPSQSDLWRVHAKANNWTDEDLELLLSWGCRDGAKIKRLTWELAELSDGRTFTLRNLRLSQKSSTSLQTDDEWLTRFPAIRDPDAPVAQSPVVIGGAVAGGPGVVISDRSVVDGTRASQPAK